MAIPPTAIYTSAAGSEAFTLTLKAELSNFPERKTPRIICSLPFYTLKLPVFSPPPEGTG
jgi:hypothetical protein